MLELNAILKAVAAAIQSAYPGQPVYWDRLPKDFKRPSFAMECQKDEMADLNIALVRRTVTIQILCFIEVDSYHDSSREALNQRQETVMGLLGQGYLQVGDRALTVQANRGTGDPDWAEVVAVFSWTDERPGYQDPEAQPPQAGGAPLMEHYALNINGKD